MSKGIFHFRKCRPENQILKFKLIFSPTYNVVGGTKGPLMNEWKVECLETPNNDGIVNQLNRN